MKRKGCLLGVGCAVAVTVGAAIVVPLYRAHLLNTWKRTAIPELARYTAASAEVARDLDRLRALTNADKNAKWFSGRLIPFPSGEWTAYANKSIRLDWRYPDMVITKGSDGRWFYTTAHFCPDLIELYMEGPPATLGAFRQKYFFRQFSGDPEEKLDPTWSR
jgi:hypothetical protein